MFDRISDVSNKSNGEMPADLATDEGPLAALLNESESIAHVVPGSGGIDHTTEVRSTSFEPSGSQKAYMLVTDETVYFVLGDAPESAEVSLSHVDVTMAELKSGLLSTTILVKTAEEAVRFKPADGDQAEVAVDYVSRLASIWDDFVDALAEARETVDEIENRLESGKETSRLVRSARSYISNARHAATHDDDAPTETMDDLIDPVESKLDRLCTAIDTTQIESLLEDAREAKAENDHESAFSALAEAHTTIEKGRKAVTDGGALETINELGSTYDELVTMTFKDAEAACHEGQSASDPGEAVEAWRMARERYQAALSAEWDGEASVSAEALEFQLAWVTQRLIDSLLEHGDALEAAGDEQDSGVEQYERAKTQLERARELAAHHAHATAPVTTERIEELNEKVELSEWQWGNSG
jgi:hypothetical protein